MNRRDFVKMAGVGGFALSAGMMRAADPKSAKPVNVLFFFIDDLRVQLGCYGKTQVKSPNIDKLAADGMLFERAYCSQAVCAPTRVCTLSGLRPDDTGIYDLDHPLRKSGSNVVTLPQHFKQRGYETVTISKVYHHDDDDKESWTRMPERGTGLYALPENMELVMKKQKEAEAKGLTGNAKSRASRGPATECADVPDQAYIDGRTADTAVKVLRDIQDKPFFMCVGFYKPHLPFCAPKKYWDLYNREQFDVPSRKHPEGMPSVALSGSGEIRVYSDIPKVGPVDDGEARKLIHGYHACVSYTDEQVGKVLAELDKLGLADNTIVVIWGDHGWKLGDYGEWCKHTNFELDTHVPLIFRGPGVAAGKRCRSIVEMVDVYPTLADVTGSKAPEHCAGESMRALLEKGESAEWKDMAVSQYPRSHSGQPVMGYSLRKDKWRYTEWHRKDGQVVARELYDHSGTDIAAVNAADMPENAELVAKLSGLLKPFIKTKWEQPSEAGGKKQSKKKKE